MWNGTPPSTIFTSSWSFHILWTKWLSTLDGQDLDAQLLQTRKYLSRDRRHFRRSNEGEITEGRSRAGPTCRGGCEELDVRERAPLLVPRAPRNPGPSVRRGQSCEGSPSAGRGIGVARRRASRLPRRRSSGRNRQVVCHLSSWFRGLLTGGGRPTHLAYPRMPPGRQSQRRASQSRASCLCAAPRAPLLSTHRRWPACPRPGPRSMPGRCSEGDGTVPSSPTMIFAMSMGACRARSPVREWPCRRSPRCRPPAGGRRPRRRDM